MTRIFGQISQIGYVVHDVQASIENWLTQEVGPWFYIERLEMDYFRHRGVDSTADVSVALASSGDLQIELIQQHNDAPSLYRELLDTGKNGMHHVAYWTTNYEALYDRMIALGYVLASEGCIGGEHGRFAYFETERDPGSVIELSDISGPKGAFFSHVRGLAASWDGTDPVRRLD